MKNIIETSKTPYSDFLNKDVVQENKKNLKNFKRRIKNTPIEKLGEIFSSPDILYGGLDFNYFAGSCGVVRLEPTKEQINNCNYKICKIGLNADVVGGWKY